MSPRFLAVDLGAESGRALVGVFDGERVELEEVHRFPNAPVRVVDGLHWDVLGLMREVREGLKKAGRVESVGVDAWGVDYGMLDREGALVSNPYHYRDSRTQGMIKHAHERVLREEAYTMTGIQVMPINTVYQLLASEGSPILDAAETLLLIPDLINYWLAGEVACEYTNATTTGLYDLHSGGWAEDLMSRLGIPSRIFPRIVGPGVEIGALLPEVARAAGLDEVPVTTVASHDTASAIVAAPTAGEDFAYISSGTWSLVGVEVHEPVLSREAMQNNFTNEGGFGGTICLLKNVMGLWLLQECRRIWAQAGDEYSYEELVGLAGETPRFAAVIDPDDPRLLAPPDMPAAVKECCEETGQELGEGPGAIARCIFESLALKYRWVLEKAAAVSGRRIEAVHVVGGGARNELLCQLTADATRLPVLAGPVEATALGNVMVQAYARGLVGSLGEVREVVRASAVVDTYEPREDGGEWEAAYGRMVERVGEGV